MNYLYLMEDIIKGERNYIYGDGKHAVHMEHFFEGRGLRIEGFCTLDRRHAELSGKKVITVDQFNEMQNASLLLTQNRWQAIYDELYHRVDASRIYVNSSWLEEDRPCIMCGNPSTFYGTARFVPFLKERMFRNEERATQLVHCPRCGSYYSSYRPSDEEMDRLYTGYRDEVYQKMREKYEPSYTWEFNRSLFDSDSGGGRKRKAEMSSFLAGVEEIGAVRNVLDFGGDKGQFIPEILQDADKYVYEVSGTGVVDGVTLITDKNSLNLHPWDLILCNMVLEHLPDVQGYFRELASLMGKDTLLYVEVPYEISHVQDGECVFIHEHINFFGERVFRYLAKMNGLEVLEASIKKDIRVLFKRTVRHKEDGSIAWID